MSKHDSMKKFESMSDFWLGLAGAASFGFAQLCRERQDRKRDNDRPLDVVEQVTFGLKTAFDRAATVVDEAYKDLGPEIPLSPPRPPSTNRQPSTQQRPEAADKPIASKRAATAKEAAGASDA
ncbi:MAG: hypothetical protein ABJA82_03745 [Myxococcales bacterium]